MGLNARGIKGAMAPGKYHDGHGLYLIVKPNGRKSWIYRYQVAGRRRDAGLGPYPEVTLAEARELHFQMRRQVKRGKDPLAGRQQRRKVRTFQQVAEEYIEVKRPSWTNPQVEKQWSNMLRVYAYSVIGAMPIDQVDGDAVLAVLRPIWTTTPTTGTRLRARLENILDYGSARKERTGENPARKKQLDILLPKVARVVQHHAAVPWREMPEFMRALRRRDGVAARALEFMILTAARGVEVRGATWPEIDLDARMWTVPPERYKTKREHRQPLSGPAAGLLERLPRLDQLVFTHGGRPIASTGMNELLKRMKADATPHGFRSSFADWAGENGVADNIVVEKSLGHVVGNAVEAAYRRGDLFSRRQELMLAWAEYIG